MEHTLYKHFLPFFRIERVFPKKSHFVLVHVVMESVDAQLRNKETDCYYFRLLSQQCFINTTDGKLTVLGISQKRNSDPPEHIAQAISSDNQNRPEQKCNFQTLTLRAA